jgi:glutamate-1-semialdehyde 2,1-aminomutase
MPDITTLGKIIGGGLPVGAYGGRKDIMSKIAPEGPVYQAGTLSGNPLAMAAGISALKKLNDKNFYKELSDKGKFFCSKLIPIIERYNDKVQFRNIESIFCLYFTDNKNLITVSDVKNCNMKLFGKFHSAMLNKGIYLSPSGYEVGFLSSSHSEDDIIKTINAIEESFKEIF